MEATPDTGKQVKKQAELLQPQQEGISPLGHAPVNDSLNYRQKLHFTSVAHLRHFSFLPIFS